jgi:hypothetical protein
VAPEKLDYLTKYWEYRRERLGPVQDEITTPLIDCDNTFFTTIIIPLYYIALDVDRKLVEDRYNQQLYETGASMVDAIIEISKARKKEIDHGR